MPITLPPNQRAAMFGLDARIALAIFGGLAIVAGMTLYRQTQNAHLNTVMMTMNEVAKAVGQFSFDNKVDLRYATAPRLRASDLVTNPAFAFSTWNGPYVTFPTDISAGWERLRTGVPGTASQSPALVYVVKGTEAGTAETEYNLGTCDGSAQCWNWVVLFPVEDAGQTSLRQEIDRLVDGSNSPTTGRVRYSSGGTGVAMQGPYALENQAGM